MERKFIKVNRDLTGQKVYLLTAIKKIEKNKRWFWECLCECGNTTTLREDKFMNGKVKSCGCISSRHSIYKVFQKAPGESAHNSHFTSYQHHSKKREIEFLLTREEFNLLTEKNCFYCNAEPRELSYNKKSHGIAVANGIDRIDSNKPYIFDNCVPCCKHCNIAKAGLTQENFFNLIKNIFNNLNLGENNGSR